jgi:hypothetical protein
MKRLNVTKYDKVSPSNGLTRSKGQGTIPRLRGRSIRRAHVSHGAKLYPFHEANTRMSRIGKIAFVMLLAASPAFAQTFSPPDSKVRPWSTAKMNIGPIYFAPTFELSNLGVDNNVYNDEDNPVNDITGTLGMRSLVGVHYGESLILQVTQNNQYNYFRRERSERSIDNNLSVVLEMRTAFFRPWARWNRTKSSQRLGFEIDERAEKKTPVFDFGADINAAFRLGVSVAARRGRLRFKDTETYKGQNLSDVLDQQNDIYQGLLRYQLTEFSEIVVGGDYQRDRFSRAPERDNDSQYYYGGLRIKTGTIFTGNAMVGYRQQKHTITGVPDFSGVTADIALTAAPSEAFKLEIGGTRDVTYSYLPEYPFILDEGASAVLTNRFAQHFDWVGSARGRFLSYDKTVTGASKPIQERTYVLGLGTGYYIGGGTGARIGFMFERWQRTSPVDGRSFKDNRISSNYRFAF